MPEYTPDGDWQEHTYKLVSGNTIAIAGKDLRRTATGLHAHIAIRYCGQTLAWSILNIEKDEDRQRLANSAHKHLSANKADIAIDVTEWSQSVNKHAVDEFCEGYSGAVYQTQGAKELTLGLDITPLVFLIPHYVILGGGTILFGPKGAGKTMIALLMALGAQYGVGPFKTPEFAKVLFVQMERSEETFGRRIQLACRALGLPLDTPLLTLIARGRSLGEIRNIIKKHVAEDGVQIVILDSVSRAGGGEGGSLKNDDSANSIMDTLNAVAPAWLALAHTSHEGKGDAAKAHIFGSVMFENAADVVVQIKAQRGRVGIMGMSLEVVDANDFAPGHRQTFALEFDGLGLSNVREAKEREFAELGQALRQSAADKLYRYVDEVGKTDVTTASNALDISRQTVTNLLGDGDLYVKLGKEGREVMYSLLSKREEGR